MVEIQCPHCEEDIELEDGAFGLFDCPHCDEEFTWEDDDNDEDVSNEHIDNFSPATAMVKMLSIIVGIFLLLVGGFGLFIVIALNW